MPQRSSALPIRPPRDKGRRRTAVLAAATALLAGSMALTANTGSAAAATTHPRPAASGFGGFSPYADLSLYPQYDLANGASTEGTKYFNLAFVTDGGSCDPKWGGVTDLSDQTTTANIAALRSAGGDVRVSFGGANGTELATSCSSATDLAAAYQKVIDQYSLTDIDFDVEGASVADTTSVDRRNQAIAILEQNNPVLQVSYTLPVLPNGLTSDGVNILNSAKNNGATIAAVNVMAMDYGSSFPTDMGQNAIDAATATQAQIKSVWPDLSDDQAWNKVAVTPMIGLNDLTSETFTLDNAASLVSFAQSKYLAWLSFWSATRDQPCPGGSTGYAQPTCSSVDQSPGAYGQAMSGYTG
ncbi:chitinase [Streptomyces sp. RPT161]|uniref:chitinase n=1 Tax=Streptomyces sp. RPT161 TaxID=3015993 RepID=UPI0022B9281E|nr:chitinase [Streptomyces sp. RPT161]